MSWHKKRIGSLLFLEVGHSNQSLMKLKVDDEETEATNPLS